VSKEKGETLLSRFAHPPPHPPPLPSASRFPVRGRAIDQAIYRRGINANRESGTANAPQPFNGALDWSSVLEMFLNAPRMR